MEIKKIGMAGTMESSDISIIIEPSKESGINITLQSPLEKQFGTQIRKVIKETIINSGVENAMVKAVDKGAIDYVIKARTETALYRALDSSEYNWKE